MSAVWQIWSTARTDGAPSSSLYRRALVVASLVDRAAFALDGLEECRSRLAATSGRPSPDPDEVFRTFDQARLVVGSLGKALDALVAMRRSVLLAPDVATPHRLKANLRALRRDLVILEEAYSPEGHALLGTLHGMPDVGLERLVAEEPLFGQGRLDGGRATRSLTQLRQDIGRVEAALHESWRVMAGPSPTERIRGLVRRARSVVV